MDADTAGLQTGRFDAADYKASRPRENLLERLFVVELLRTLWSRGAHDIEILRPSSMAAVMTWCSNAMGSCATSNSSRAIASPVRPT
jgi:hypothetical protein